MCVGMLGYDVAAGSHAIEFRHPIIHQNDVGLMSRVSLDRLEPGADHFHNLVFAAIDQGCQAGAHTFLIVCNKNAHTLAPDAEASMPIGRLVATRAKT